MTHTGDAALRRLGLRDWFLIGTLVPFFAVVMALTISHGVRHPFARLGLGIASASDADSHPRIYGVLPGSETGVRSGDQIVAVGGMDLRGASLAGWRDALAAVAAPPERLPLSIEREGARFEVAIDWVPIPLWWGSLPFAFAAFAIGLFLFVRAHPWPAAGRHFAVMTLVGIWLSPYLIANPTVGAWALALDRVLLNFLIAGLAVSLALESEPSAGLAPRWQKAAGWLFAGVVATCFSAWLWLPDRGLGSVLSDAVPLVAAATPMLILVAMTRCYRRADTLGKRRMRWILYGSYVACLPYAAYTLIVSAALRGIVPIPYAWIGWLEALSSVAFVAIPLGVLVSVVYYDRADVDRLFGATLSYSLLGFLVFAGVFALVPTASQAATTTLGLHPATANAVVALSLAALAVPANRLLRPRIDQWIFPERVAVQGGFDRLLAEIATCGDARALVTLPIERLTALLRPTSTIVYARDGDLYTPIVASGRPAPPAFATQSALVFALQERAMPLVAERWTRRGEAKLSAFERAALETLEAAVIIPIRRGPELVAFSCLGPKRSGDIYTTTELALLGAVASRVSDRLLSLDAAVVAEQAQAMHETMRRYVPGAVAERIASGHPIEAGEREVSVLFVDLRGYTSYSERRDPDEIFSAVSLYTETVSRIVKARHGSVVDFSGDGVMAVFGAPDDLPGKERAAVAAGRAIVGEVAALPTRDGQRGSFSVGVGIATGLAFVGDIRSADRLIWGVIGNTTNLAARLQSLTRELDAAIAVDDTTFRRAGDAAIDFVLRANLPIRGRAEAEDVHLLPLGSTTAPTPR